MHVNIYDEEIGHTLPVKVYRKVKDGVVYHGVAIHLRGHENQLTIWSRDKEKLSSICHGMGVYVDLGVASGTLHVGEEPEAMNQASEKVCH